MDSEPVQPLADTLKIVEAHAERLARLTERLEVIRADIDGIHRHLGDVGQRLPHLLERGPRQKQDLTVLQETLERAQRELVPRLQEAAQGVAGLKARVEEVERRYLELAKRYESTTADAMRVQETVAKGLQALTRLENRLTEVVRQQEEVQRSFASPRPTSTASEAATPEEDHRGAVTLEAVANRLRDLVTADRVKIDRRLSEIRFTLEATADRMKKAWRLTLAVLLIMLLLVIAALLRPEIAAWLASARGR